MSTSEAERGSHRKDVAILLIGTAAGLVPWLLDKWGVDVPHSIITIGLCVCIGAVLWSLIELRWVHKLPLIGETQISFVSAVLIGTAIFLLARVLSPHSSTLTITVSAHQPNMGLTLIKNQKFENESVPLDGY